MQKLRISISIDEYTQDELQHVLGQILPFVDTVKTLHLQVSTRSVYLKLDLATGIFDDIFKLSELKELMLGFYIPICIKHYLRIDSILIFVVVLNQWRSSSAHYPRVYHNCES